MRGRGVEAGLNEEKRWSQNLMCKVPAKDTRTTNLFSLSDMQSVTREFDCVGPIFGWSGRIGAIDTLKIDHVLLPRELL
jgi:hypothetical protein